MSQSSQSSQTLLDTTVCCIVTNGHCGVILKGNFIRIGNIVLDNFQLIIKSHVLFANLIFAINSASIH